MNKALLAVLFVFTSASLTEAQVLSPSAKISLLTASPGEELYSTFGHSGIRVKDPEHSLDIVFNYGTFNPFIKNFYVKFARRKVDYYLSVANFSDFIQTYIDENRSIIEHELNLDDLQKSELYKILLENYKPENRAYRYDFFFDNCATRIRDIVITAFGQDFRYNYPEEWQRGELTFRNLIDLYLTNHHWSDFGIDLALGLPTDQVATPEDYMFLPDYLMEGFATATIRRGGKELNFTKEGQLIIPMQESEPDVYMITPMKLSWFLFAISILLSYLTYTKGNRAVWFDKLYFSLIGLVGWVVFLLWFFTDHIATKDNINLLWAVPLYFPGVFFFNRFSHKAKLWIVLFFGCINVVILALWPIFPQHYHNAFIPLILIILIRFLSYIYNRSAKLNEGKTSLKEN